MLPRFKFATFFICAAITTVFGHDSTLTASTNSIEPLYLFPNGTAAENLFVREDGSVLMTMIYPAAELYYFPTPYTEPVLLYNFTNSAAGYGVVEYAQDLLAVCTGTFSRAGDITNTTGFIWRIDLTNFTAQEDTAATSNRISEMARLDNVGFLNGAVSLDDNNILVSDSVRGVIYSIDTQTGNYSVVLNDTALAPNATGAIRLGVNGLIIVNNTLYFTNTNHRSVGKVRLTVDGTAASSYTDVATNVLVDDFDVDPLTGEVYIASLVANAITYVSPKGTVSTLVGSLNSTDVPGPTSIRFARTSERVKGLYRRLLVSTSGGYEYPINGTYIQGGGLYELNITTPHI